MTIKGQKFGDIYRTVPQSRLIDTLLLEGYAHTSDITAAHNEIHQALERWSADGVGFRLNEQGERLFDPVEVVSHLKNAGLQGRDDMWETRFVPTLQRFVSDLKIADDARLTYSRTFTTGHILAGQSLRLRMPLPLSGRYGRLEIKTDLPPEVISHRINDGRLEARIITSGSAEIRLGVEIDLEHLPENTPAAAPPTDIYLRPKEGLIVITPLIEALAQRLAGTRPMEESLRAFWNYLMDDYVFNPLHYDQISPEAPLEWVMDAGCYDCQLASAFFVALCRARGLPARLVGGHFLYRRSPTNHYWAEVWLEDRGWTPFDFLSWDLSRGGRDMQWRDHFHGQVDARLITECLPQFFVGALGVPVPLVWHILRTAEGGGAEVELIGVDGLSVYRDQIAVL